MIHRGPQSPLRRKQQNLLRVLVSLFSLALAGSLLSVVVDR